MSMSAALAGQINIETGGGAGAKPLSVAEERRRRLLETADEVACPGGCGGMAWLEHAVTTATRDGETRHFRMATCAGECKMPVPEARGNYAKTRPGRFEVPADAPEPRPAHPLPEPEQTATMAARNAVQAAMQARSVNVYMLASDLRLDYTKLRRWLDKGKGLPPHHVERLEQWLATAPSPKPDPTPPKQQQEEPTAMAHGNRKIGRDEEEREKVKAALEKVNWPVVDLAAHIGASRTGFFNWLKMGKGVSAQKVASAVEWAAAVDRGEVEKNLLSRQQRSALTRMERSGKSPQEPAQAANPDAAPPEPPKPRPATMSSSKEDVGYDEPTPWEAAFRPALEQGAMDRLAELVGPEAAAAFRVRVILSFRDRRKHGYNAKFIAHARIDVPALCAEVRHLRGLVAKADEQENADRYELCRLDNEAATLRAEVKKLEEALRASLCTVDLTGALMNAAEERHGHAQEILALRERVAELEAEREGLRSEVAGLRRVLEMPTMAQYAHGAGQPTEEAHSYGCRFCRRINPIGQVCACIGTRNFELETENERLREQIRRGL